VRSYPSRATRSSRRSARRVGGDRAGQARRARHRPVTGARPARATGLYWMWKRRRAFSSRPLSCRSFLLPAWAQPLGEGGARAVPSPACPSRLAPASRVPALGSTPGARRGPGTGARSLPGRLAGARPCDAHRHRSRTLRATPLMHTPGPEPVVWPGHASHRLDLWCTAQTAPARVQGVGFAPAGVYALCLWSCARAGTTPGTRSLIIRL
jgi:hypothetical protein